MDEVILRTIVIQFDGRVAEVFRPLSRETYRQHVALMDEPKIGKPDSRGRTPVTVLLEYRVGVDADEMPRLRPPSTRSRPPSGPPGPRCASLPDHAR
jgi:hypothetical protein